MRFRPSGLICFVAFLAGFVVAGTTAAAAFFFAGFVVAGAAVAAFCAAQRFLTASAMRFRPSGLLCLFFAFFAGVLTAATTATPAFFFAAQRRFKASAIRFR